MADSPWRLTDEERRRGGTYLAEVAAVLVFGPVAGPFAVLAARYFYDRRDRIFSSSGAPVQAFDSTDRAVAWRNLAVPAAGSGTLSVRPQLTESARRLGVREGDPVGLVLTGHSYTTARSGLVVPARIGQRIDVAVPRGTYSVGAFAGRRDQLFTRPHPFDVAAGQNVLVGARGSLALPLTANVVRPQPLATVTGWVVCPRCAVFHDNGVFHRCVAAPAIRPLPRPVVRPRPVAATPCWWCGHADPHCSCVFGGVRRFLDDL